MTLPRLPWKASAKASVAALLLALTSGGMTFAAGSCSDEPSLPTSSSASSSSSSGGMDGGEPDASEEAGAPPAYEGEKVIVVVFSGLSPALVGDRTPNLQALAARGVTFQDHHAILPSTTMTNAASLATGRNAGRHGMLATTTYQPNAHGQTGDGTIFDGTRPLETDDDGAIEALASLHGGRPFKAPTLFERAQAKGARTLAIGAAGAAYLQDPTHVGMLLDEQRAYPLDLVQSLLQAGVALPRSTPLGFAPGRVTLPDAQAPYARQPIAFLHGLAVSDPQVAQARAPNADAIEYFSTVFLQQILPDPARTPDLTILWFPSPDDANRVYGPGTVAAADALNRLDGFVGDLQTYLDENDLSETTDVIVLSEHGASSISGDPSLFPFRDLVRSATETDPLGSTTYHPATIGVPPAGPKNEFTFPVSGEVRAADLLYSAGWTAYDGPSQVSSPVLSGVLGSAPYDNAARVYPSPGTGIPAGTSTIPEIPAHLPPGSVVVAPNGGSELLYVEGQDPSIVAQIVQALESRQEIGAIFVADTYGALPGTLPFSAVGLAREKDADTSSPWPDIVVTYRWDDTVLVSGLPGIEYSSMLNRRGTSGGSSPADVHALLIAAGPSFKVGAMSTLPSSVADLAPTIARIMKLDLADTDGRVLEEGLSAPVSTPAAAAASSSIAPPSPATNIVRYRPTSPFSTDVDPNDHAFTFVVHLEKIEQDGKEYVYTSSAGSK